MHEVEAWTYARKILKKNNISRKGLLKIAAYSLNNRIEKPKEKPPYTESWTLALKTFFKVIAIYFRYYQETKTLYKFGQIVQIFDKLKGGINLKEILDRLTEEDLIKLLKININNHPTIPCIINKPLFNMSKRTDR